MSTVTSVVEEHEYIFYMRKIIYLFNAKLNSGMYFFSPTEFEQGCIQLLVLSNHEGDLSSPEYPELYGEGMLDCQWKIVLMDRTKSLNINFRLFDGDFCVSPSTKLPLCSTSVVLFLVTALQYIFTVILT